MTRLNTRLALPAVAVLALIGAAACGGSSNRTGTYGVSSSTSISDPKYHDAVVHKLESGSNSVTPTQAVAAADCIVAAFQKAGYQTVGDVNSHKPQASAMASTCGAFVGFASALQQLGNSGNSGNSGSSGSSGNSGTTTGNTGNRGNSGSTSTTSTSGG